MQLLDLDADSFGPFMLVRVFLQNGSEVLRWGLDKFTYFNLRASIGRLTGMIAQQSHMRMTQFSNMEVSFELSFYRSWNSSERHFVSKVVMVRNGNRLDEFFLCSRLFASNLEWLSKIRSVEQLNLEGNQLWTSSDEHQNAESGNQRPHVLAKRGILLTASFVTTLGILVAYSIESPGLGIGELPVKPGIAYTKTDSRSFRTGMRNSLTSTSVLGTRTMKPKIKSLDMTSEFETIHLNVPFSNLTFIENSKYLIGQGPSTVVLRRPVHHTEQVRFRVTNSTGATSEFSVQLTKMPAAKEIWFGNPSGNRVYITIDDGWFPRPRVLQLMETKHLPITAFLIENAVEEHMQYWKNFVKAGGVIEDHTVSHPDLALLPLQQEISQWGKPVQEYQDWFGTKPILGRPPYGAVNQTVLAAAASAGLRGVVMWSAEFDPNHPTQGLVTYNHKPLAAGDIILLHWQAGLYQQLEQVLTICKQRHLVPAPLLSGLPFN